MRPWRSGLWRRGLLGLLTLAIFNTSCSVNILGTFADKTSNEALYESAIKKVNSKDYTGALTDIASIKGAFASLPKVLEVKASAYAGRCGLNFLNLAGSLQNMGSTLLFPLLLSAFPGATTSKIDDCVSAEGIITSIGTVAQRSDDENIFMVLVEFAKIGSILNYYADSNADGAGDAGFDACAIGGGTRTIGTMDDSDARELGTGLTIAMENITALSGKVNLGSSTLTNVNSECAKLSGALSTYNFCSVTTASAFTATQLKGIRSVVKESVDIGLGTNCTGNISTCNCP